MGERGSLDRVASVAVIVSALTVAGVVVYRTLRPEPAIAVRQPATVQALTDSLWQAALRIALPVAGVEEADATIIEFTDLECPACRGFEPVLDEILSERTDRVRLMYVPHPLTYHRFAMGAANAAECAAESGSLRDWIASVYSKQDSLGLKSWASLAREAGISDTNRIASCASRTTPFQRITAGLALGASIGLSGTPMVLVNGLHFQHTPSQLELESVIDSILDATPSKPVADLVLTGRVMDKATMALLADAVVALVDSTGSVRARAESDSFGEFSLQSRAGRYRLTVDLVGYRPFRGRLSDLHGVTPPHAMLMIPAGVSAGGS